MRTCIALVNKTADVEYKDAEDNTLLLCLSPSHGPGADAQTNPTSLDTPNFLSLPEGTRDKILDKISNGGTGL